jgi:hypothetical protein
LRQDKSLDRARPCTILQHGAAEGKNPPFGKASIGRPQLECNGFRERISKKLRS